MGSHLSTSNTAISQASRFKHEMRRSKRGSFVENVCLCQMCEWVSLYVCNLMKVYITIEKVCVYVTIGTVLINIQLNFNSKK